MSGLIIRQMGSNQNIVEFAGATYFFSYETCVAFSSRSGNFRRDKTYSITTSKHMRQMCVKDWPQVPDDEFEKRIIDATLS